LLEVAWCADPDQWRNRLRAALEGRDRRALQDLAEEAERALAAQAGGADLPPPTLMLLGEAVFATGENGRAVQWSRQARRWHPGDFWLNHNLGMALMGRKPAELGEAVRYLTAAVALHPDSAGAHLHLGVALRDKGLLDEAIAEYRQALRIRKDLPLAHLNLGIALQRQGQFAQALAALRRGHELGSRQPGWRYPSAQLVRHAEQFGRFFYVRGKHVFFGNHEQAVRNAATARRSGAELPAARRRVLDRADILGQLNRKRLTPSGKWSSRRCGKRGRRTPTKGRRRSSASSSPRCPSSAPPGWPSASTRGWASAG
jgi:tetratricopeptide (TPR) repeat protein